ncbi:ribonucleotide-diphosphate reductase subunit beta [Thermoflavimicrobium daqui]|jgi:ribonucleoside-diphosphate reductase beta chain|uniref:Ribonucleoside-diphosphate reductase subunit beta n=1 Tax=Thermoflavimicrobium daqui TaxID=2137476 RepID=A0A364K0N6_9BACL|nr:ribonucleotide-diphosphate reductase subunit beta [Thermoflavimicrobium daqui]RAL21066.1 ribonucleotide-diphosphate reductase subunit beta [Thermoflavimicrobium daqui]
MAKLERKKIFNEHGQRGTQRLINGNTTNLREWNRIKYDWAFKLYRTMLNNFWVPEEIPLASDAKEFNELSTAERHAFDKTISFLNFLDSIQGENLPNINEYITAPEVSSLLNIQAFQEEIHAQSYSYILDSVCSPETRENIYDEWRNDEHLLERNRFIADLYQQFVEQKDDRQFVRTCMANFLLESLYFYSGFSFFYSLARAGKMTATATIIKYIQRDELTHVVLFQNMIKELRKEEPDLFSPDFIEELRDMTRTAVEHEIKWGQYITNNQIPGLNNNLIERYIKYLANERLNRLGFEILYPEYTTHPMKWVDSFANLNATKTDFFEQKVTNYTKASSLDFGDL